jgi:signal peptide peptidase SppA
MKKNNEILAILADYAPGMLAQFDQVLDIYESKVSKQQKDAAQEEWEDRVEMAKPYYRAMLGLYFNQRKPMTVEDGVAMIHVKGILRQGLSFLESCVEATDYKDVQAELSQAKNDPEIKSVLLDIDSPGGSVVGCLETAKMVQELGKPVTAHIDSLGGSAAYFIACGADAIYASESAFVGSIGTIATFMDYAGMLENAGITPHIFTSEKADMKAAGNMLRTPTPAEKQSMQDTVKEYGEQFLGFVLANRPGVSDEVLRGNAVSGARGLATGLIDGIASREDAIEELKALA